MPNGDFKCTEHSGFKARIVNLEKVNDSQWEEINKMDQKIDKIFSKINVVLVGLAISSILLAVNIIVEVIKKL
jgi:hypothetical protein